MRYNNISSKWECLLYCQCSLDIIKNKFETDNQKIHFVYLSVMSYSYIATWYGRQSMGLSPSCWQLHHRKRKSLGWLKMSPEERSPGKRETYLHRIAISVCLTQSVGVSLLELTLVQIWTKPGASVFERFFDLSEALTSRKIWQSIFG